MAKKRLRRALAKMLIDYNGAAEFRIWCPGRKIKSKTNSFVSQEYNSEKTALGAAKRYAKTNNLDLFWE